MYTIDTINHNGEVLAHVLSSENAEKGIAVFHNKLAVFTRDGDRWNYQSRGRAGTARVEYVPSASTVVDSLDEILAEIKSTVSVENMPSITCRFVYAPNDETRMRVLGVRRSRSIFDHAVVKPMGKEWSVEQLRELGLSGGHLSRMLDAGLLKV